MKFSFWKWLKSYYSLVVILLVYLASVMIVATRQKHTFNPNVKVIRLAHWQLEEGMREAINEMADKYKKVYEEQHPGEEILILQDAIPESTYGTWLTTQFIGGTIPDIVQMGQIQPNLLVAYYTRYIVPLTKYVEQPNPYNEGCSAKDPKTGEILDLGKIPWRKTMEDNMAGGYSSELQEYVGVSITRTAMRVFYNIDLLKKLTTSTPEVPTEWPNGLDHPPKDYHEFYKACQAIQKHSDPKTGLKYIPIIGSAYHFSHWDVVSSFLTYPALFTCDLNFDGRVGNDESFVSVEAKNMSYFKDDFVNDAYVDIRDGSMLDKPEYRNLTIRQLIRLELLRQGDFLQNIFDQSLKDRSLQQLIDDGIIVMSKKTVKNVRLIKPGINDDFPKEHETNVLTFYCYEEKNGNQKVYKMAPASEKKGRKTETTEIADFTRMMKPNLRMTYSLTSDVQYRNDEAYFRFAENEYKLMVPGADYQVGEKIQPAAVYVCNPTSSIPVDELIKRGVVKREDRAKYIAAESMEKSADMKRQMADFCQNGFIGLTRDDGVFIFVQQRGVFITTGTWDAASLMEQAAGNFKVGVMNFPDPLPDDPEYGEVVYGPRYDAASHGVSFSVTRNSKYPEIAVDFLRFITAQKNNERINKIIRWIPMTLGTECPELLQAFIPNYRGVSGRFPGFTLGANAMTKSIQLGTLYVIDQIKYRDMNTQLIDCVNDKGMEDYMESRRNWRRGIKGTENGCIGLRLKAMTATEEESARSWTLYRTQAMDRLLWTELSHKTTDSMMLDHKSVPAPYEYSSAVMERIRQNVKTDLRKSAEESVK